jgi:formate hydrogenlyase subunit 6/NADH:ubiquinone oxidoreductase subunit I
MSFKITDKCIGCSVCKKICPMACITGERGKYHKIDPQLCIECYACGYICPQSAVMDADNHFIERIRFRKNWPRPLIDKTRCTSCVICLDSCPVGCLALAYTKDTADQKGYPVLADERACIACEFCAVDCPVGAIEMVRPADT